MNKNGKTPKSLIMVLLVVLCFFLPIENQNVKFVLALAVMLVWCFFERGTIYFMSAAKKMQKGKREEAFVSMKKAVKAGLDPEYKIYVGVSFIQQSDEPEYGIEVLKQVYERKPQSEYGKRALSAASMGYFRRGDDESVKEAIKILEDLRAEGWSDNNLRMNLGTYYLDQGELEKAAEIIAEASDSPGNTDNRGELYIMRGEWRKAKKLYKEFTERSPRFPEAYVHAAQCALRYGKIDEAKALLEEASGKLFVKVNRIDAEFVKALMAALGSENGREDINTHPSAVATGRPFRNVPKEVEFVAPDEEEDAKIEAEEALEAIEDDGEMNTDIDDDDIADINTDLDDDEEEGAKEN